MRIRQRLAAATLVATLLAQPLWAADARAQETRAREASAATQFATGFASFIVSPVYGGFQVAMAFIGCFVGGATWIFSGADTAAASKVWNPTMKGTYVISPEHLRGEQPIQFLGPR